MMVYLVWYRGNNKDSWTLFGIYDNDESADEIADQIDAQFNYVVMVTTEMVLG